MNTYHHQQWAPDVPWIHGYGIIAHSHELGILAELGVIGLVLWICVLALVIRRLWTAYRTLPDHDICGKPLAVTAIMAIATLICAGFTVDLRLLRFSNAPYLLARRNHDRLVRSLPAVADGRGRRNRRAVGEIVAPVMVRHG